MPRAEVEALEGDDPNHVLQGSELKLRKAIDQVLDKIANVGYTVKELTGSNERIQRELDMNAEKLSQLEDLDAVKGKIDKDTAELKHNASLDATASLIQPTLINFLK